MDAVSSRRSSKETSAPQRPGHGERARRIEATLEKLDEPRFPKVDELLGKIFNAPQYENLSILEKEQAVIDFLSKNRDRWQAMLVQEGLFAQQTAENIDAISIRCTLERTNRKLIPTLVDEIRKVDYRFVEILKSADGLSESLPLDLIEINIRALKRLSARHAMIGPYEIIGGDVIERYAEAADELDGIIAGKTLKPLKKYLNLREIGHSIRAALLIYDGVYLGSVAEEVGDGVFSFEHIEQCVEEVGVRYPDIPVFLFKMAFFAHLPANAEGDIPAVARLVSLLCRLGRALPQARRDGTSEGFEQTVWSAAAEELAGSLSETTDAKLIEELCVIAEEKDW